jgi:hypothetical protein
MTKNIFFSLAIILFASLNNASAEVKQYYPSKEIPLDSSKLFREECLKVLNETTPSVSGKTSEGNNYKLFAIKKRKTWTYLILDSSGYYSVKQEKDQIEENPTSYTDMIVMMVKAKMLKKKDTPKNVSGLTFSCYYRFKPSAKKTYRSMLKIQRKVKFYDTNLKGGKKGIMKILNQNLK